MTREELEAKGYTFYEQYWHDGDRFTTVYSPTARNARTFSGPNRRVAALEYAITHFVARRLEEEGT